MLYNRSGGGEKAAPVIVILLCENENCSSVNWIRNENDTFPLPTNGARESYYLIDNVSLSEYTLSFIYRFLYYWWFVIPWVIKYTIPIPLILDINYYAYVKFHHSKTWYVRYLST